MNTSSSRNNSSRFRLKKKTKIIIIGVFALLWGGIQIHEQIRFANDPAQQGVQQAGDYIQTLVPAAGFAGSLLIGDIDGAIRFALGCSATAGITSVLKQGIDAKRPNGGDHSFPSGHTAFAFQGAAFILRRYGWKLGILALLLACFVGYSRIESDKHWTRDVLAGAAIGIACSYAFTGPFCRHKDTTNI